MCLAPLFGGNIFSILFGRNLDAHTPSSPDVTTHPNLSTSRLAEPLTRQCLVGRACYTTTLAVTTFACVVALGLSLVAAWRDRWKANVTRKYESLPQEPAVLWENENEAEERGF